MRPNHRALLVCLFCLLIAWSAVWAGDREASGTAWDGTVNSLLSAGMYGLNRDRTPGLTIKPQQAHELFTGLAPGRSPEGQAITFSYEGSSGLLAFSAGYILSRPQGKDQPGSVFLGLDPDPGKRFDPARSWYLALNLSRAYQVDEHLSFNLGNRIQLSKNPLDTEEGHLFSLLFNLPIAYKNYLTITPELQWTLPVSRPATATGGESQDPASRSTLYGGVSVSFSY